jgi:hypothetical protein
MKKVNEDMDLLVFYKIVLLKNYFIFMKPN